MSGQTNNVKDKMASTLTSPSGADRRDVCEDDIDNISEFDMEPDPIDEMQFPAAKLSLSFCGCGFLGIYHLGVVSCLLNHGKGLVGKVDRIAGASAGALIASVLVFGRSKVKDCIQFTYNLASELHSKPLGALTPRYNVLVSLQQFLDTMLPEDAHEIASGKIYISLSNIVTRKNELHCDFNSREELIKCLIASSYVPIYAGVNPPTIRGKKYMDGGMTDNLPVFKDGRTILVSPFSGHQDICPADKLGKGRFFRARNQDYQVNFKNITRVTDAFFPPNKQRLHRYFVQGMQDTARFLKKEGFFEECPRSNLSPNKEIITSQETV